MTTTGYEIPTSPFAQSFQISIVGTIYTMTLKWNTVAAVWVLDIGDANGNGIVNGIALVTGVDLIGQYGYLNFGGMLFATTDYAPSQPPTYFDLGSTGHLYFLVVTPDDSVSV